jgi:hypothetical protein
MALVEARGGPASAPNVDAEGKIARLLQEPFVELVDLDRRVALIARELGVANPKLKGADAVHMASAIYAKAEVLLTQNSKHFPVGSVVQGVWVDKPYRYGGPDLFSASDD